MKISVITINLNNSKGLEKTIKSVLAQCNKDYEYIVVDGGSSDGSVEVIKKYSDSITYWISEKDNGLYNAMNKGINVSNGEYCLFLNSGDCLCGDFALSYFTDLQNPEDIVYGDVYIDRQDKKELAEGPDDLSAAYFWKNSLGHSSTFIKKTLFDQIGCYNESIKISSDHDFFFKAICVNNSSYKHISRVISVITLDGISCDPRNELTILKEHHDTFKINAPLFYPDYLIMGDAYFQIFSNYSQRKSFRIILKIYRKFDYCITLLSKYSKRLSKKVIH